VGGSWRVPAQPVVHEFEMSACMPSVRGGRCGGGRTLRSLRRRAQGVRAVVARRRVRREPHFHADSVPRGLRGLRVVRLPRHTRVVRDVGSGGRMRVQPGFHARGMPVLVQIVRRQLQASVLPRPSDAARRCRRDGRCHLPRARRAIPAPAAARALARPVGRLFRRVHAGGRCRSPRQGRRPRVQALARRRRRDARAHLGNLVVQRRFVPARRAVPAHARAHLQHDACAVDERRAPAAPQIHGRPVLPRAPRPGTASSRQRAAVPV